MLIDASALVAILTREPGWEDAYEKLANADAPVFVSPLGRFEAVLAIARIQSAGNRVTRAALAAADNALTGFLAGIDASSADISETTGTRAIEAAMTYGKVVGHPAKLNLGDCFAYACAKAIEVPLLYKGDDFVRTDLG